MKSNSAPAVREPLVPILPEEEVFDVPNKKSESAPVISDTLAPPGRVDTPRPQIPWENSLMKYIMDEASEIPERRPAQVQERPGTPWPSPGISTSILTAFDKIEEVNLGGK